MTKQYKLNSSSHFSKAEQIKRHHVLKAVSKGDKSGLKPSKNLSKFGKNIFKAIVQNNKQLNSGDSSMVNLLCHEYEIYIKATDHVRRNGLVEDGKKSPYYSIMKQSTDEIVKLSGQLSLDPKNRINSDMHAQEKTNYDPVRAVIRD